MVQGFEYFYDYSEKIIETTIEFNSLDLHPKLMASIDQAGFKNASPIQELTLIPILDGKDIFAQAETGSGKTCAFVIPILEQILRDEKCGQIEAHESRYVVLSPTRELAQQTFKVFQQFGNALGIKSCSIIGGESIENQKDLIGKGKHVLVATPGRLADLIKQKVVTLNHCKGVVFDEADRLFDMGFKKDIEFILSKTASNRQLIMLSATSNQDVLRTAYKFNSHPEELILNEDSLLVDHIDHKIAMVSREEKFPLLVNLLRKTENTYAIVFCNTQFQTHSVAEWLIKMGFKAQPISGRLAQNRRTKLMTDFRSKKVTILVCTDVAARGLDIKNIKLVINYDLPQEASNYVHRIGRTGRAGEEGVAISFCAHEDCEFLDPIYKLIDDKIEKLSLTTSDFATDICKKPYIDRKTLRVSSIDYIDSQQSRPKSTNKNISRDDLKRSEKIPFKRVETKEDKMLQKTNSSNVRIDRRFFEIQTYGVKKAGPKAMDFLRINDESLLGHEVLEQGKRKYLLFGPKKTKFKFFIKPIYKRLLLPYLIDIIKMSGLNLYVKVSYKPGSLLVSFNGNDERLLTANHYELINAFEHLIKTYLQSRIILHRNLKILVRCYKSNDNRNQRNNNNEQGLIKLAESMRKKVLESNDEVLLKPLNASDRRIIHQFFQDDAKIQSSSIGDGRFKQVKLSFK